MMAQSRAESTWDIYNYGQYINQFPPNTIKAIQQYERINKKICRQKMSIMFNEIYIYIYIYIGKRFSVIRQDKEPGKTSNNIIVILFQNGNILGYFFSFSCIKNCRNFTDRKYF